MNGVNTSPQEPFSLFCERELSVLVRRTAVYGLSNKVPEESNLVKPGGGLSRVQTAYYLSPASTQ